MSSDEDGMQAFTEEQKQYLQGFMTGAKQRGAAPGGNGQATAEAPAEQEEGTDTIYGTPVDELNKQERIKLERNGLDIWDKLVEHAEEGTFPDGPDVFRFKFRGLFYVKPAQNAFMMRLRIPGCELSTRQFRGLADGAEEHGGGYSDITSRGNLQIREIGPRSAIPLLLTVDDLGLTTKGAGGDNVRNITATPTCGFDPQEIFDMRPLARTMNQYILHNRDMHGLPRKFNISFDSGGRVSVMADTNDIGVFAVRVGEGHDVEPGVYFRVELGGITGHEQFATDTGLLLREEDVIPTCAAMLRVYIENGDRTNRNKARLKYLLDDWGIDKFVEETEKKLERDLTRLPREKCEDRPPYIKHGHIGWYDQKQDGRQYLGVAIPGGRMQVPQMRGLAEIADEHGSGDLRLTVHQNLIIPDLPVEERDTIREKIQKLGFDDEASSVLGGVVACTGNTGCKFSATNTKGQALKLSRWLDERLDLPHPINIHLTGCSNSCAQHYCGDIGLLGVPCKKDGESVEGYTVFIGGGADNEQGIARQLLEAVPFEDLPEKLETLLAHWLDERDDEPFVEFARGADIDHLKSIIEESS